ncbi:unnamed protein product [Urochloa humidicola]
MVGGGFTKAEAAAMMAEAVEAANKKMEEFAKAELERSKKRTKTVRVKQEYIDLLLKRYPFKPYPGEALELEMDTPNGEARELLRILLAPTAAAVKAIRDKEEAIVKQFLVQGYAETEVEIYDDDDV